MGLMKWLHLLNRWEEDSQPSVLQQYPVDFSLASFCKENKHWERNIWDIFIDF